MGLYEINYCTHMSAQGRARGYKLDFNYFMIFVCSFHCFIHLASIILVFGDPVQFRFISSPHFGHFWDVKSLCAFHQWGRMN